jgi:hypothetical protein
VYTLVGTFSLSEPVAHAVSMDANVEIAFPSLTHVPDFWDVRAGGCNTSDIIVGKGTAPGCAGHLNAFCRGDTNDCDVLYSARIAPGTNVLKLDLTLRPPSVTGVAARRVAAGLLRVLAQHPDGARGLVLGLSVVGDRELGVGDRAQRR